MGNFVFSVAEIVNNLQELLRDRYPEGAGLNTIVKELLQNADDARATQARFTVLDSGLSDAGNDLLHGPALVCLNNGRFEKKDEKGLRTIAGGAKADELGAVGRFGVGQKSVFHLCEAWLYLGLESREAEPRGGVLNPWAEDDGDPLHEKWDIFSRSDRQLVQRTFADVPEWDHWLLLWIPLRLEAHERRGAGFLTGSMHTASDVWSGASNLRRVATLLPQLAWLEEIRALRFPEPGVAAGGDSSVRIVESSGRLVRPNGAGPKTSRFRMQVEASGYGTTEAWGVAVNGADPELAKIAEDPRWPSRLAGDGASPTALREKLAQNGAVTVVRQPASNDGGTITASWAVFLPVEQGRAEIRIAKGSSHDWHVLLHGYFFPDSGRRSIPGIAESATGIEAQSEGGLRRRWNALLRDRMILPNVVPALGMAAQATDPEGFERVLEAFTSSSLFEAHREAIGRERRLALVLGVEAAEWQIVPLETPLLPVPRLPKDRVIPSRVLDSILGAVTTFGAKAVAADAPIVGTSVGPERWGVDALQAIGPDTLVESLELSEDSVYLADCVRAFGLARRADAGSKSSAARVVLDWVRRTLARRGTQKLLATAEIEAWKRIVSEILGADPQLVVFVSEAKGALRDLAAIEDSAFVLLPSRLRPDSAAESLEAAPRSLEDVAPLLRRVAELAEAAKKTDGPAVEELGRCAAVLLRAAGPLHVAEAEELKSLRVLPVWSARTQANPRRKSARDLLTPREIGGLKEAGRAFREVGVERPQELARLLFSALKDQQVDVVLMEDGVGQVLDVPALGADSLFGFLSSGSEGLSQEPQRRASLFKRLCEIARKAPTVSDKEKVLERCRALRHVMHGRLSHLEALGTDLLAPARGIRLSTETLRRIAGAAGEEWRIVGLDFTENLTQPLMVELRVRELVPADLQDWVRRADEAALESLVAETSATENRTLHRVLEETPELWRRLPVHGKWVREEGDAPRVAATAGRAFLRLDPNSHVPPKLEPLVDLILPADRLADRRFQSKELEPWGPAAQIEVCLIQEAAALLAEEILEALRDEPALSNGVDAKLRDSAWLPTSGSPINPGSILLVPPEVEQALPDSLFGDGQSLHRPIEVVQGLRAHQALQPLFVRHGLTDARAIEAAAEAMQVVVGAGDDDAVPELRKFWISGVVDDDLLSAGLEGRPVQWPGWALLRAVASSLGRDQAARLYASLVWDADPETMRDQLNALAECGGAGKLRGKGWDLYVRSFSLCAGRSEFLGEVVPELLLRNRAGRWVRADRIARSDDGCADEHRLDKQLREAIRDALTVLAEEPQGTPVPEITEEAATAEGAGPAAEVLKEYFESWRGEGLRHKIGILLCLLGDGVDGSLLALANEYLDPRDAAGIQEQLNALYLQSLFEGGALPVQRREWPIQVRIERGQTIKVKSLAGTDLLAGAVDAGGLSHLIVEPQQLMAEKVPQCVRLREISGELDEARRSDLLHASFEILAFRLIKRRPKAEFETLWHELGCPGQVTVAAARARIVAELPAHIRQLGYKENPTLRQAMRDYDRAFQRLEETRPADWVGGMAVPSLDPRWARSDLGDALNTLAGSVERDKDTQRFLLGRLRRKLDGYQYDLARIPLELFQNADDAAVQLTLLVDESAELPPVARTFSLSVGEMDGVESVTVTHWGRPINEFGRGTPFSERGRELGFDLDLINMVLLNVSDKGVEGPDTPQTTGRFGLGFKAVQLATERPLVESGSLNFEIVAGLLPITVEANEETKRADGSESLPPTRIMLPLEPGVSAPALLRELREYGGLLPVFAQRLRRLLLRQNGRENEVRWEPGCVDGVANLEVGEGRIAVGGEPVRWLKVTAGNSGGPVPAILLRLEGSSVRPVPNAVPSIWCTAPTRDCHDLGVVLNGPFAVDVGRSRLAATGANNEVLERIGSALGQTLRELALASEASPEETAEALGFSRASKVRGLWEEFWSSMWDVLAAPVNRAGASAVREILNALHRDGRGLSAVAESAAAIPTKLPPPWSGLTSLRKVRFSAPESLADDVVAGLLGAHAAVGQCFPPGTLVSGRVAGTLRELDLPKAEPVTIPGMLEVAFGERIAPKVAADLEDLRAHLQPSLAEEPWKAWAASLRFESAAGEWRPAGKLLLPPDRSREGGAAEELGSDSHRDWEDERRRSAFAPPPRRLHDKYDCDPKAREFFLRVRRRLEVAEASELETWARGPTTMGQRIAVLRYLLGGQLAPRLMSRFREEALAWLEDAAALQDMDLSDPDKALVVTQLFPPRYQQVLQLQPQDWQVEFLKPLAGSEVAPMARDKGRELLQSVVNWWASDSVRLQNLRRWHEAHYPAEWPADRLRSALGESDDPTHDEAWMLLLTLGACQQLGRTRPEQHRGFIHLLQREGHPPNWWAALCRPGPPPADWVQVVEEWADRGLETRSFEWWRGLLPVMYQLRRWLEDYRRVIRAAEGLLSERAVFDHLWTQRTNVALQGTELDAPPLMALSGIGGHWVMRELSRLGVAGGEKTTPHCYPPRKALLKLLGVLGLSRGLSLETSTQIHRALVEALGPEGARFHGSFDIPLTLVSLNADLREALMRGQLETTGGPGTADLFSDPDGDPDGGEDPE